MSNDFVCVRLKFPFSITCTRCINFKNISSQQYHALTYFLQTYPHMINFHIVSATAPLSSQLWTNIWHIQNYLCKQSIWSDFRNVIWVLVLYSTPRRNAWWNTPLKCHMTIRKYIREKMSTAKMLGWGDGLRGSSMPPFRLPQQLQNELWNLRCTSQVSEKYGNIQSPFFRKLYFIFFVVMFCCIHNSFIYFLLLRCW